MPKPKVIASVTAPVAVAPAVAVLPPQPVVVAPVVPVVPPAPAPVVAVSGEKQTRNRVSISKTGFLLFLNEGKTIEHTCNTVEEVQQFIRDLPPHKQNRVTVFKRVPLNVTTTIAFQ